MFVLGAAAVALATAILGLVGAAAVGRAATTQQVSAGLSCQPSTAKPGKKTGCTLTVTNTGGNAVNGATVTVQASAGTFLSSTSSLCAASGSQLTCTIGKLTAGSAFSETHDLQLPTTGASVSQTVSGQYSSPTGNNRGSATIAVSSPNPVITTLNASGDFDATFSDGAADSVQTAAIGDGNPYSTGATLGTAGFAVGLTVNERAAGSNNVNCPSTGCFGGQVVDFSITPLDGVTYPDTFQLTIKVYVGPGVKSNDLDVRHTTTLHGTNPVPLCADGADPSGDCVVSRPVNSSTKIATILIQGPGTGNGGWGVG